MNQSINQSLSLSPFCLFSRGEAIWVEEEGGGAFGTPVAVSPAQVELTAEEPMAWSNRTIRLVTGGLAGTHAVSEIVSNTVLRIRGALGMPGNEVSGGEAFVMASEAIAVEKMPGSPLPPLQAGERVYLS